MFLGVVELLSTQFLVNYCFYLCLWSCEHVSVTFHSCNSRTVPFRELLHTKVPCVADVPITVLIGA